ncbi:hypothetical protein B0H14DRAFT_2589277 [Mycena olivaceomarginata]|nr:hypothetical protein B0H14DRAFT_2589277 [Mycena olivaceomarginata]
MNELRTQQQWFKNPPGGKSRCGISVYVHNQEVVQDVIQALKPMIIFAKNCCKRRFPYEKSQLVRQKAEAAAFSSKKEYRGRDKDRTHCDGDDIDRCWDNRILVADRCPGKYEIGRLSRTGRAPMRLKEGEGPGEASEDGLNSGDWQRGTTSGNLFVIRHGQNPMILIGNKELRSRDITVIAGNASLSLSTGQTTEERPSYASLVLSAVTAPPNSTKNLDWVSPSMPARILNREDMTALHRQDSSPTNRLRDRVPTFQESSAEGDSSRKRRDTLQATLKQNT